VVACFSFASILSNQVAEHDVLLRQREPTGATSPGDGMKPTSGSEHRALADENRPVTGTSAARL
jgi:hypothetical protein